METTTLPRETALLVVLLEQLQRQWALQGDLEAIWAQLVRLGVGAAPSAVFRAADGAPIEVRGLAIGDKLFVHVVAADAAVRLDLVLPEYTKQVDTQGAEMDPRTHSRVGQWLVSTELLQWRLERNVFPVFRGATQREHVAMSAGAELGRLPEPLLLRIAPFLSGKEYCGMTQTNKFLHEYADKQEIWEDYVAKEYPSASTTADEAASKALYIKCHEREKRRADAIRSVWASLPPPPPHVPLIDPFARPSPLYGRPPLNGPIWPPDMPRPPLFDF